LLKERQDAIKSISSEILAKEGEIQSAQKSIIDATAGVSDAFSTYRRAVMAVKDATIQFNLQLAKSQFNSAKAAGSFVSFNEEMRAVQKIFNGAESAIMKLGGSERFLADLRKQAIEEQIGILQNALNEQSALAKSFFTSSLADQQSLTQGIKGAQDLAGRLGGSFENFKKLGEGAINALGNEILNLPQEFRQDILKALETLDKVGVGVGGFSSQELQRALETVALGTSEDLQIDPLFEVQDRIARLTEQQSRLQLEAIVLANEQVKTSKEQLGEAQTQKSLAEIQLERLKEEGGALRSKLGELRTGIEPHLITQNNILTTGFAGLQAALGQIPGSLNTLLGRVTDNRAQSESKAISEGRGSLTDNAAAFKGGLAGSAGTLPDLSNTGLGARSNLREDQDRVSQEIADNTEETVKLSEAMRSLLEEIRGAISANSTVSTALPNATQEIDVTITTDNQVTIRGFENAKQEIARIIREETGNFIKIEQLEVILDRILTLEAVLKNRGLLIQGIGNTPFGT
jgi:hypothetical protein